MRAKRLNTGKSYFNAGIRYALRTWGAFILSVLFLGALSAQQAYAACPQCCGMCDICIKPRTVMNEHSDTRQDVNEHITEGFKDHRQDYILDEYWEETIKPGWQRMTAQLTSVAYQQVAIVGSFFDATIQLESQLTLQEMQADAVKDYAPSTAMCSMGTATRSLAASEAKGRANQIALSARGMQRQLNTANSIASGGPPSDKTYRAKQFIDRYCSHLDNNADPDDEDTGLGMMCTSSGPAHKQNMDIDFIRTIAEPMTIKMDLTNDTLETTQKGADEEDVIALASNLYAHNVFKHIATAKLRDQPGNQESYLELRSLAAKRNLAMNSFNAIAGMKGSGSGASGDYLKAIANKMGVDNDHMTSYLGENPSYYAQMEFLTKKLYQEPGFVADLVDRPANVKRQHATMTSFELMQQRDVYKSMKRSEMLVSMLLELQLRDNQANVEDTLRKIRQR